jgi:hypothetical protein
MFLSSCRSSEAQTRNGKKKKKAVQRNTKHQSIKTFRMRATGKPSLESNVLIPAFIHHSGFSRGAAYQGKQKEKSNP